MEIAENILTVMRTATATIIQIKLRYFIDMNLNSIISVPKVLYLDGYS